MESMSGFEEASGGVFKRRAPRWHLFARKRVYPFKAFAIVSVWALCIFFILRFSTTSNGVVQPVVAGQEHNGVLHKEPYLQDIYNETLGFQKIYVINLPERTDNRDSLTLAATYTGLRFEWIDAVHPEEVSDKAKPFTEGVYKYLKPGALGCWRSHANVLEKIIEENVQSALIMEGDADWDIRLKEQMVRFARSTLALTQPLAQNTSAFADPTFPLVNDASLIPSPLTIDTLPQIVPPKFSPYGDGWDLLIPGHCGTEAPWDPNHARKPARQVPKGHVLHFNDPTTPPPKHRHTYKDSDVPPFARYDKSNEDEKHTRMVFHPLWAVCAHGYAITQAGARRFLFDAAVEAPEESIDLMLRHYCEKEPYEVGASQADPNAKKAADGTMKRRNTCLAPEPPLMGQFRPKGSPSRSSNIRLKIFPFEPWSYKNSFTHNIQKSTRANLGKLVRGVTDIDDMYPDD